MNLFLPLCFPILLSLLLWLSFPPYNGILDKRLSYKYWNIGASSPQQSDHCVTVCYCITVNTQIRSILFSLSSFFLSFRACTSTFEQEVYPLVYQSSSCNKNDFEEEDTDSKVESFKKRTSFEKCFKASTLVFLFWKGTLRETL